MELQTLFGMFLLISAVCSLVSVVLMLTILYLLLVGSTE